MSELQGASVLITGASDGIGAAVARELARRGARRLGLVARRADLLEQVASDVRTAGAEALVLPADVTRPDEVSRAARTFLDTWGAPDLLLLNAGIGDFTSVPRFDAERALRVMAVNYGGAVHVLAALLPALLQRGQGHVVVTSSLAGQRGLPTVGPYSASKAALDRLFESLRLELEPLGIRCTLLLPGFVRTQLTAPNRFKMPFLLTPEEAAMHVVRAIRLDRRRAAFPWPMALFTALAGLLPDCLYDRLMRKLSPRGKRSR